MNNEYAILPDRIKAAIIDSIMLIAAMYVISEILSLFDHVPNFIRIGLALIIFVLYDPFFTSQYGATVGHSFSNIMVKKEIDRSKNISFPAALLRFLLKIGLGWISLLTVTANKKRQAIHDVAANSVVIKEK